MSPFEWIEWQEDVRRRGAVYVVEVPGDGGALAAQIAKQFAGRVIYRGKLPKDLFGIEELPLRVKRIEDGRAIIKAVPGVAIYIVSDPSGHHVVAVRI